MKYTPSEKLKITIMLKFALESSLDNYPIVFKNILEIPEIEYKKCLDIFDDILNDTEYSDFYDFVYNYLENCIYIGWNRDDDYNYYSNFAVQVYDGTYVGYEHCVFVGKHQSIDIIDELDNVYDLECIEEVGIIKKFNKI